MNMELGYLMPPMGENLFLASIRFKRNLSWIYASTIPYLILIIAVVFLVTYVPQLTLWPVQLFFEGS
jgi:TRAP-type C4-dicarboxylate transport system permease large subunit